MFFEESLQRSFHEVGATCPAGLFSKLQAAYSESGRHYHSVSHVVECLKHFAGVRGRANVPAEIELAIWFHDAVYDPRAGDNEEQSADWAVSALKAGQCPESTVEAVRSMVLATKSHVAATADEALLLDIDLGVLGASHQSFQRYDAQIRLEYEWVPIDQYREARRAVLQGFLDRDAIYQTDVFARKLEAQARSNLTAKVNELGAGSEH